MDQSNTQVESVHAQVPPDDSESKTSADTTANSSVHIPNDFLYMDDDLDRDVASDRCYQFERSLRGNILVPGGRQIASLDCACYCSLFTDHH